MIAKKVKAFGSLLAISITAIIVLSLQLHSCAFESTLVFADAGTVWWTAPTIFAGKKGWIKDNTSLYEKNGLKLITFDVNDGLSSKNAVVAGTADVGLVASTPLALGAYTKENLVVLGSYVEAKNLIAIITPKISAANQKTKNKPIIPEAPIAVVPGTISEFYLYNYAVKHRITTDIDKLSKITSKPPAISSLIKQDAKSASIWEPFVSKIDSEKPNFYNIIRDESLYTLRLFLVTRPDVIKNKTESLIKFIKSIDEACDYINQNRENARNKISVLLSHDEQTLPLNVWNKVKFEIAFDYEEMLDLILNDSKLARKLKIRTATKDLSKTDLQYYFDRNFLDTYTKYKK